VVELGRIEVVSIRDIWPNEASDFTPWLLENPDYLSEALGIDVELVQRESGVGPYAVDLIGRDLTNETTLIVENQLGRTDHSHLGQLITYAANTDAVTVVWVARNFTDEHRQAIDYLNNLAGDSGKGYFYGVEVSAIRIGNSQPAARFAVVASPNEEHATEAEAVRDAIHDKGKGAVYRQFWKQLLERAHDEYPGLTNVQTATKDNWLNVIQMGIGHIALVFNKKSRANVQLYIDRGRQQFNQKVFDYLLLHRDAIEGAVGTELSWEAPENKRMRRIVLYRSGESDVATLDNHQELINFFLANAILLRDALSIHVEAAGQSAEQEN
jgi:hypothetical protein